MVQRISKNLIIFFTIWMFSACSTVTIKDNAESGTSMRPPDYQKSMAFFLSGIAREKHVQISDICPESGVEQIVTERTFLDGLWNVFTYGIYSPRTVKIWCKKK